MKQMIWGDKLCKIVIYSSVAPIAWPGYIVNDVALLELLLRRKDPQEYGFDKHWETSPNLFD